MERFFNRKIDYFWEIDYPFANFFLKEIFKDNFKRKYSLIGSGIYNLIYIDNKIYEVKLTQGKELLKEDNKQALRDKTKDFILDSIKENLQLKNINFTGNSGKFITFEFQNKYIIKLEIIKKLKEPI